MAEDSRIRAVGMAAGALLCWCAPAPATLFAQDAPSPPMKRIERPELAREGPALTLADCYALALKRSETIAIQRELIKQTEGQFLQALSGALPDVSFELSQKRQDDAGGSARRSTPERKFVFTQPLFSGFKEFAAMAGSRAQRRQREHEQSRAEQRLFVDVSDSFHFLLQRREDLGVLETTRAALTARMEELASREQLGRSRPSEVVSAMARLRRVEAQIELAHSDEATAAHLLEFLTGRAPIASVIDPEPALPPLDPEEAYASRADRRPDVRAAEEAWQVAKKAVLASQADFWPGVDLESHYYTKRVGASQGIDWDVLLTVDVPLFQGGQVAGEFKEKRSQARQAQLALEEAKRKAVLEISNVYADLQGAIARDAALRKALEASEENYRLQVEDYRLSLVNNLDVLQTLQELEDARRDAIGARHEMKRLYWQLRVAVGETL